MLKNVAPLSWAIAFPISVFPVPGGLRNPIISIENELAQKRAFCRCNTNCTIFKDIAHARNKLCVGPYPNRSKPLGVRRNPVNRSGRFIGQQTISRMVALASSSPAMSSKVISSPLYMISLLILSTSSFPKRFNSSGSSSSSPLALPSSSPMLVLLFSLPPLFLCTWFLFFCKRFLDNYMVNAIQPWGLNGIRE